MKIWLEVNERLPIFHHKNLTIFMMSSFPQRHEILIEGVNIEYGNIEKCNIDTKLTSKISRRVTSKR